MADLLCVLQRAFRRAAKLPVGHCINLALYAAVVLGLGLIALEIRSAQPQAREVRPVAPPVQEVHGSAPAAHQPPTGVNPGEPVPAPSPAALRRAVIEQPAAATPPAGGGGRTPL